MLHTGYALSGLIAAAIMILGLRFWLTPGAAVAGFGIGGSPPSSTGFAAWLSVKGTRDIASGLFVILLMVEGPPRLLGEFMLIASLIAFGHMVTVLRSRGNRALAFGMHGLTGLVLVATGACLMLAAG
jgi:hypothetical protein